MAESSFMDKQEIKDMQIPGKKPGGKTTSFRIPVLKMRLRTQYNYRNIFNTSI